jgi:putative ABC transport system permease protein
VRERSQGEQALRRANWVFTREQRITFGRELPRHNELIAGALWSRPGVLEVSVEQDYARDLGVGLGSRIAFDVQGVPVELLVTSLRNVEWRSFSPNFFLLAEPGALDDAPYFRIGALRVDAAAEQPLQDAIAARYPNVTLVRVRGMVDRVSALIAQLALGVRLLGGFAVLTGLVIVAGAAAATQLRRAREAALLKTLGVTRARVIAMFAIEYALLGAVAGTLGAAAAYALAFAFTSEVLGLPGAPSPVPCLWAIGFTALLAIVGGLLASARALVVRPLQVLRQEA